MALVEAAPRPQEDCAAVSRTALLALIAAGTGALPFSARAEESGPSAALAYVTDLLANFDGGEERGTAWLGRADLTVAVPGSSVDLQGVDFFADLMLLHGNDFSGRLVGDGQVVSNIDAPSTLRPIEVWANLDLAGGTRLKVGIIDLNTEFDVQRVGSLFINSSHGIGPDFSQSGHNGPSIFPSTSLGAVAEHARDGYELRVGIFDALPGTMDDPDRLVLRPSLKHGALLVGEGQLNFAENARVRVGGWHYSKAFEMIDPADPRRGHSSGWYAMAEGPLLDAGDRSLNAWVRVGGARSSVNPIEISIGTGLAFGNDDRKYGFALSHARLGDQALTQFRAEAIDPERAETVFELTYATRLAAGLQIQPNVQYVVNPGWDRSRPDALVVGMRLAFDLTLR